MIDLKYFVLKPKARYSNDCYAQASCRAMLTYAREIEPYNSDLAHYLREWAIEETENSITAGDPGTQ